MKLVKILNIKGALLDKQQLENYLEKIASDHVLQNKSSKETYPIKRLEDNFKMITKTYEILNLHLKQGINIHPAGEWLLDNYYIIEETVKTIQKDLTMKKYINFPGLANGAYEEFARIYVLATEIVAYTDSQINSKVLEDLLRAYQTKKTLDMEEIWNIGMFIQIAIVENIRNICEKIYSAQMQKYKVENILERLVEYKTKTEQKYKMDDNYKSQIVGSGQMKYPFIEYMSYRLKRYGKKAYNYLNILEEQVNKMGATVSDIIKKEHFDIATKKVSIGNCIKSMKEIQRINFLEIFENINGVELILKQDPANVYENMDYKTKAYYRSKIKEISKKTKISEIYISKKVLELAQEEKNNLKKLQDNKSEEETKMHNTIVQEKKTHIGYYLISDGIQELYNTLQTNKTVKVKCGIPLWLYIGIVVVVSAILPFFSAKFIYNQTNIIIAIVTFIVTYIPSTQITIDLLQAFLNKIIKPKLIPKMNYENGIPDSEKTMVIIPTIVKSSIKVKDLIGKLEVFYHANKSENMYFTLLADVTSGDMVQEDFDQGIVEEGIAEVERLNKKYSSDEFGKFHFIYRKRSWSEGENCYLGWERKRGLINQFNEYLLGNIKNPFRANSMEGKKIPKIKYIITLDADTNLVLNTGLELVGAMAHILNKPEWNENNNLVIAGHGLIQPRVGIDLVSSRRSIFTKIFAGAGGTDSYTNAISDTYQDNFGEGIFTGKGIYDLETFSTILKNQIPENTVLSHDLLEGNYLRCGLASDILLLDGYPYKYNAYISRAHRWIRGDWQILRWMFSKNSPLKALARFKILDNLRRSLVELLTVVGTILTLVLNIYYKVNIWPIITILFLSIFTAEIIEFFNYIASRETAGTIQKYFSKSIIGLKGIMLRAILTVALLPHKAYMSINAISKTIYRMCISKKHLLEWTTAEEAELSSKTSIISYYQLMFANVVLAILLGIYAFAKVNVIWMLLAGLWIVTPAIMGYISKENREKAKVKELKNEEIEHVIEIGKRTWNYFETYMNKENNYLPPDNFQEDRNKKIVNRTSSTNIGLGLIAIISAYDLGYIDLQIAMELIQRVVETIQKLSKWNGHLYNWYNTKTLQPLIPRYISTVDSGNFIGYLYVLKEFLKNLIENEQYDNEIVKNLIEQINDIIIKTDFNVLYDKEKRLFSIGFDIEENRLTDSYYDLLASEARQASLVAIAKHDIPTKHWQNLSRTLTCMNGYRGLVSWSGTAFEYLMPNINMKQYKGSLLDESINFMLMSQKEYAKKIGIPWGISESAFNLKDLNSNYQYKAFGIPWLGLKRGLADEMVVSSYGSIMAIQDYPKDVLQNLKMLEEKGMYDKYGFYEAIDFTPGRVPNKQEYAIAKTYMAHHQALILLAINNLINNKILQERFFGNPEIKAVDILLQERMPEDVVITKEKKEKIEKLKNKDYENYSVKVINKMENKLNNYNIISNENYTICMNENGEGFSKYKNIFVNRYKYTNDYPQGIFFFVKNIRTKKVWKVAQEAQQKPDKYEVIFTPDMNQITTTHENISCLCKVITSPAEPVEIRTLEIKNNSNTEEIVEVSSLFEPVLSSKEQDYSHMAFNNLFLKYDYLEDMNAILITRNKRGNVNEVNLCTSLVTHNETVGDLEYEIDEEKMNYTSVGTIPKVIENSVPFSKQLGLTTCPIVAFRRTIKIPANEKVTLNLIISVCEDKEKAKENLEKYKNGENTKRAFELSKARVEEEARYLGIKGSDIETYQKVLSYLVVQNPMKSVNIKCQNTYKQSDLWRHGISGDFPILLLKIKDVNDSYIIKDVLKLYEFCKAKNIEIELVILNEEESNNGQYIQDEINSEIENRHMEYLKNIRGGIFVLKTEDINKEYKSMLELRANLIINAHSGNIRNQINEQEEEYLISIKEVKDEKLEVKEIPNFEKKVISQDFEKLKYYNEYGAFSEDGKEYIIRLNNQNKLPNTWSNILANEKFGTIVTQNMGGYTWYKNCRVNRITAWSNDSVFDTPSEIIYIKDKGYNKMWSLNANLNLEEEDYCIKYGFGYAIYTNIKLGLLQEVEVFVPTEESVKINLIKIKNTMPEKRNLKFVYYIKPVLGEDEIKSNGYINLDYDENSNIIFANNLFEADIENLNCYVSSSEKIASFTGNKKLFMGNGTIQNPDALKKEKLNNNNSLGQDSCIAVEFEIELKAYEDKEISIILGSSETKKESLQTAYKYTKIENCKQELENVKNNWREKLRKVQVRTPVESMNIMLNGWLAYQTIVSRLWAKSGYYQSGGAYGFRDQLQDVLGMKYLDTNIMKKQILKHATHQFLEGDVEHWWHEETSRGIRTKFSDDLLWLPYVTAEYVEFTGDYSILEEQVPYIQGEVLQENEDERYDIHKYSEVEGSIYEHCIKAIEKGINLGEHGIPKIGSGDWNDGFSTVGNKGKGESVWLGFFIYEVLNKFIPICEYKQEIEKVEKYKQIQLQLKKALNMVAWDGRWYKRAFMDDGQVLGTIENEECRIDSIAQSWAVISNAGDNDKKYIAMESLENHLVDKENGIIKLLDPAFNKSTLEPGYIKAYLPGVRENGGQYTHSAVWAIIANTLLGFGDKAGEYFRIINPIEHSTSKETAYKYKVEPYVIAADIYGVGNLTGRGGWTWYTGSSSWFYKAGIECILGLRINKGILTINPCIPKEWKEYSIRYEYQSSIYNIKVKNQNGKNNGIEKFIVNGEVIPEKQIKLIDNGKIWDIEVEI